MTQPIPSWYEGTNATASQVAPGTVVRYGQVDADTMSTNREFYFWNNRDGNVDVSKMEDVTITTRDRNGGLGDTVGSIVEAVRDNWMEIRCDTNGSSSFTPVGKGGVGTVNPTGVLPLGTNGSTTNINASTAVAWGAGQTYSLDAYYKPTVDNGFIYRVISAGITGTSEPTWLTTQGLIVEDGGVRYVAVAINTTPQANEILGLANNTLPDGSNASEAGGNFVKLTTRINVPFDASSGLNEGTIRVSWKYV